MGMEKALGHLVSPKNRDAKDSEGTCAVCGKRTVIEGWLVGILRTWNENLDKREYAKPSDIITPKDIEIACPGDCNAELYRRHHEAERRIGDYSMALLRMLHAGHYSDDDLYWLRTHGYGEQVARALARMGTTKANKP